jgi:hypothetical protein
MTATLIATNSYCGYTFRDSEGKIAYVRLDHIQAINPNAPNGASVVILRKNQSFLVGPDVATALIKALSVWDQSPSLHKETTQ